MAVWPAELSACGRDDEEARVFRRSRGPPAAFKRACRALLTLASRHSPPSQRRRAARLRSNPSRGSSRGSSRADGAPDLSSRRTRQQQRTQAGRSVRTPSGDDHDDAVNVFPPRPQPHHRASRVKGETLRRRPLGLSLADPRSE